MGIKGQVIAVVASGLIGYLVGRGDGRDIEAYNNALSQISTLQTDNQHLVEQVGKMQKQVTASNSALNKRTSEVDALKKQVQSNSRKLSNASKNNSDWASERVPDDIANVLRTPSDN